MARPGPPPKPHALRLLEGNPGKRPLPRTILKPTPGANCPEFLDAVAKAEWKRIYQELMRLGLLTQLDRAALAAYCQTWSHFVKSAEQLKNRPLTVIAGNGTEIQHPALIINRAAMQKMREFAAEFGFTPSARVRIDAPGADDEDEDEAFLRGPRPAPPPK